MFYTIASPQGVILFIFGLFIFAAVAWRAPHLAAALILFLSPLYILKVKVGFLPLTALDILIVVFGAVWAFRSRYCPCVEPQSQRNINATSAGTAFQHRTMSAALCLLFCGAALATIFSFNLRVSFGILKSWFFVPMIFSLILLDLLQIKKQFKIILAAVFFSTIAVSLAGVYYLLAGRLTFDGRLSAFYLSPNHLAMYLAPGLILAVFFWFEAVKRWEKILLLAAYCLLSVILYFTFSYGAWLALLAAFAFAVFSLRRAGFLDNKKLFAVCCLLFTVLFLLALSQLGNSKLGHLLALNRSSLQSRFMVWRAAVMILKDHWFLGIGPGMFQDYYLAYQKYFATLYLEWAAPQPHNLFLAFWLQTGLLGLAGFLLLIIDFFRGNWALWRATKQPLVLALAAVIIYFLAHGLVDTPFWKNDLSLVFFAIVFLSRKAGRLFC